MRLLTLGLILMVSTTAMAKDFMVGTIDFERVFNSYPPLIKQQKTLSDLIQAKQTDLNAAQKAVVDLQKELKSSKGTMTAEDKKAKVADLKSKEKALEAEKTADENELAGKKREMMRELIIQVRDIVSNTAEKDGLDMVADGNNVYFLKTSKDITAEVLDSYKTMKFDSK